MQKAALYTSSIFFAAGATVHMARLITGFEIVVAGTIVPVWASFPGALIATLVAVWMAVAALRA